MNYQKYDKYIACDLIWLDEIPNHWTILSFGNILVERNEKNNPIKTKERLSLSINKGVTLYSEKTSNLDRFKDDFTKYKLAYNGDFVLNSMNMIVGAVGVSNYFGCVSPIYYTYSSNPKKFNSTKYYEYVFRSKIIQGVLFSLGRGLIAKDRGDGKYNTLRLKVSRTDLKSLKLPLPSPDEQTAIARFLDYKLAKINRFIHKKKQLIKLLKEQKAAIINQAVTKGLDPNAKMKDSGIEWLGEIPEHWNKTKLRGICCFVRGNSSFKRDELLSEGKFVALQYGKAYKVDEVDDKYQFFVNDEFYKDSQIINLGDVIIISTSETVEDLGHSVFYNRREIGLLGGEQVLLRPKHDKVYGKYLYYSSKVFARELKKYATGVKVYRFNISDLKTIFTSIPTSKEQLEIVNYIEKESKRINTTISTIEKELSLVEEYKTALIAEAVTGKIDVRGYVVPEVEREEESYEDLEEEHRFAAEDEVEYEIEELE